MDLSGLDIESVPELFGVDVNELEELDGFVRPAVFASSAAKVERTEAIINWEELEAASLSATKAAMAAADFLGVCPLEFASALDGLKI